MIGRSLLIQSLAENLEKITSAPQISSHPLESVRFIRRESDRKFGCLISKPSFALVVNGSKKALVGDEEFLYGNGVCLLTGSFMPDSFEAVGASKTNPFLAISLTIEPKLCDQAIAFLSDKEALKSGAEDSKMFSLFEADDGLLDAFLRLSELALHPEHAELLSDIVKREIYLRVLTSPLGRAFSQLYVSGTAENKIRRAVDWLSAHFSQPIDHSSVAEKVGMSTASYYRRFREIVGSTPSQFVRNLRLTEAKRLMIDEQFEAAQACYRVGYDSPTYFSREFRNLFGESPSKHVKRIAAEMQ